jgi:ribokinase
MFLVLGNVAVDETMSTPTLPAPGATVLVGPPQRDLGGKGANQAIILHRAVRDVRFVATIGDDDAARWIIGTLAEEGLDISHLVTIEGASDRSMIFVGPDGDNAIASTSHCSDALTPAHAEAAVNSALAGDVLLLQGGLTLESNRAAIAAAKARGLRIGFNPSAVRPAVLISWSSTPARPRSSWARAIQSSKPSDSRRSASVTRSSPSASAVQSLPAGAGAMPSPPFP